MDPQVEIVTKQICHLINVSISPNSSNVERIEANTKLNEVTKTDIYSNSTLYLNVALVLIGKLDDNGGSGFMHDYLLEIYVHYGFKLIITLVKYNWYNFDLVIKEQLKQTCIEWLNTRLFLRVNNSLFPNKISTSSLVLNACSQAITEIFIREWPNNWPNFIEACTQRCSLLTLYSFLNISDYLHTLLIPPNVNRRKEIIKSLTQEKDAIYAYFQTCLSIQESQHLNDLRSLTLEYKQLVVLKALQTLESLFEWFYLDKNIINQVLGLAINSPLNLENQFSYKVKLSAYRCILSILKQTNLNRPDDIITIDEIFHDFNPENFIHYLVTNVLSSYLNYRRPLEAYPEFFELFVLVLELSVEIICQGISQFNKDSTNSAIKTSIARNQRLWSTFLNFSLSCLQHNNANFDEILLKFLLIYSKLRRADSTPDENEKNRLISPIESAVDEQFPLQFLTLIGQNKLEPKSEMEASEAELRVCFNIDSYQNYCALFHQNRGKFLLIVHEFAQRHQTMCQIYLSNVLREMLGPLTHMNTNNSWPTGIRSKPDSTAWNLTSVLCSAIIPKLDYSEEFKIALEAYFVLLLQRLKTPNQDEQVLSLILSTISSLSSFYNNFPSNLIQQLIELIFEFTLKNENSFSRATEMQNHAGSLFIKLTINCRSLLLPFFDVMRAYIDSLVSEHRISSIQFCSLYEGLIILSNHLEDIDAQRNFILQHVLSKINWIIGYDFGVNGSNFFKDIGLSGEPNFDLAELPTYVHPKFGQTFAALNLLARFFKRMNPSRCLAIAWLTILDYITPFYKMIASLNTLWHLRQTGDQETLDKLCHPFYQRYIFADTPIFYLMQICSDRTFLVPPDKMKNLLAAWDHKSPPSPDLMGMHTQQRLCILYSQTFSLLSNSLNFLFFYYATYPSSENVMESFLQNSLQLMFNHSKSLPLVYYFDLIKLYLRNVAIYCPRSEKFLNSSGFLEILNQFLPFMFNMLDQKFQSIKQEKEIALANSEPSGVLTNCFSNQTGKSKEEQKLEICNEFVLNTIGQEFILLLRDIFSDQKNITTWASKYHVDTQQANKSEDDTMDNDDMPTFSQDSNNKSTGKLDDDQLLAKFLIIYNASPLVIIVSNCLLWPLDNLRPVICDVNTILVQSLIARNLIQSVDGFYYLAERIIRAINLTEKSDAMTVNRFLALFSLLYENVVMKYNLTSFVNPKLAQICAVDTKQWDQFAQCLSGTSQSERKKQQKKLKELLDNIYSKGTSVLYSMANPTVECLDPTGSNISSNNGAQRVKDTGDFGHDTDTFSLSWLL